MHLLRRRRTSPPDEYDRWSDEKPVAVHEKLQEVLMTLAGSPAEQVHVAIATTGIHLPEPALSLLVARVAALPEHAFTSGEVAHVHVATRRATDLGSSSTDEYRSGSRSASL
jgi:hypothetical protein